VKGDGAAASGGVCGLFVGVVYIEGYLGLMGWMKNELVVQRMGLRLALL